MWKRIELNSKLCMFSVHRSANSSSPRLWSSSSCPAATICYGSSICNSWVRAPSLWRCLCAPNWPTPSHWCWSFCPSCGISRSRYDSCQWPAFRCHSIRFGVLFVCNWDCAGVGDLQNRRRFDLDLDNISYHILRKQNYKSISVLRSPVIRLHRK